MTIGSVMRQIVTLVMLAALSSASAPASAQESDWRSLPEDQARNLIMEHAREQAQEFCVKYPADPYCHHAGREQRRQSHSLDFCARYGLHRQDYDRNGWQYWRCVR